MTPVTYHRATIGGSVSINDEDITTPVPVESEGFTYVATRALKRGHAKHQRLHNIDWWRYYVTLFTRTNRTHYQKQRVMKFLRR